MDGYLFAWLQRIEHKVDALLKEVADLRTQGVKIMASLKDVQDAVTAEDTVIDSALVLIKGLADQVAALQPNQAAIDALAADIKSKSDSLAAGVAANTPISSSMRLRSPLLSP